LLLAIGVYEEVASKYGAVSSSVAQQSEIFCWICCQETSKKLYQVNITEWKLNVCNVLHVS